VKAKLKKGKTQRKRPKVKLQQKKHLKRVKEMQQETQYQKLKRQKRKELKKHLGLVKLMPIHTLKRRKS